MTDFETISSPTEEGRDPALYLARTILERTGFLDKAPTFAKRAEVLRDIRAGSAITQRGMVDYSMFASAVSHVAEITGDSLMIQAQNELRAKLHKIPQRASL